MRIHVGPGQTVMASWFPFEIMAAETRAEPSLSRFAHLQLKAHAGRARTVCVRFRGPAPSCPVAGEPGRIRRLHRPFTRTSGRRHDFSGRAADTVTAWRGGL